MENNKMNTNDNYFSWSNINEMADIDSHIKYASNLLDKYKWDERTKNNLIKQLNIISNKQNDKLLNISVIGEFSTGKSSFINALVGYELLAINVLQGTTVAITVIEYGEEFSITLYDSIGSASTQIYPSIQALKEKLFTYTTDPAYAKKINNVKITIPSDILKNGFRIIDTPGTNSLELWHEDITRRAINEMSDLSIVLMNAQQPMPETLLLFIEETLNYTIKDCAFIANKIDLIKKNERDGIIKFIENKAKNTFDIENPIVLPFASAALTNFFTDEKIEVDNNSFMLTKNSLQLLLSHTAKRKVQAQARKVLHLIDEMFSTLTYDINNLAEDCNQQLQLLERSKQTDLRPFVQQQIVTRRRSFNSNIIGIRSQVLGMSEASVDKAIRRINEKLQKLPNLDSLSTYIKETLSQDIVHEGESITNNLESKYIEVKKYFYSEIKEFQKAFEKEFEKLKILPTKFNVNPKDLVRRETAVTANITPVTNLITEELSNENWAFGGGAAAGAAIGTMIAPGIGTAIGAFIGFFAGSAAAPNTNEVKDKIKNKLSIPLKSYLNSVASDCISNFDSYVSDASNNLDKEINRYLLTYNDAIQCEIKQWKTKQQSLNNKIKNIQIEIDSIITRQHSIRNIVSTI